MTDERAIQHMVEIAAGLRILGAALLRLTEITEEQNRILQRLVDLYENQQPTSRSPQ